MTICYFGSYDQSYGRTRVLTKGLRKNGDTVYECHSSRSIMAGRWVELFYNFLKIKCDLILVGFPGHTDVFLAWIIAKMFHKRLIFDAFISLYDSRCLDKKEYNPKSFSGRLLWLQDMITCHIVDFTLLDTHEHINFFVNEFNIAESRFIRVLVGTDEDLFYPRKTIRNKIFTVVFHGTFLPLQGTDVIIAAAKRLPEVEFKLLGKPPFLPWLPYYKTPDFVNSGDIYLAGPFGITSKAGRVIPNKAYEAIAMGKPVIVGKTKAMEELFTNGVDCLMVSQGDVSSLVEAITYLKNNLNIKNRIARNGYLLFKKRATSAKIGKDLHDNLAKLLSK